MQQITEQMILSLAPNPAAVTNGRKISQKGDFVKLEQAEDDTFYLGECKGSGKNNYITSADFIDPATPIFRCSCPSRQFPCKHSLGLLFEMMAGKQFNSCQIPEDILKKRTKKQERIDKAEDSNNKEIKEKKSASKGSKTAKMKKLKMQLEGLHLVSQLINELLNTGLGAMGGTALKTYRNILKQLGDYYLPGPQRLLNGLILEIEAFQKDGADCHYENGLENLKRLQALVKKSSQYLSTKLESGEVEQDNNLLYEELGGAWKLSELESLGLVKENANLTQLCFFVEFNVSAGEYADVGFWADIDTGEINYTQNFRPLKALKYIKQEDTLFGAVQISKLCYYPGESSRRIRWERMVLRDLISEDYRKLRSVASLIAPAVKEAKNLIKNTLSDPMYLKLIQFTQIGLGKEGTVLLDSSGETILLGDMESVEPTVSRLETLPDSDFLVNQVLFGAIYYDKNSRRIKVQPLSIITSDQVVRLLY